MGFFLNVKDGQIINASNEPYIGADESISVERDVYYDYLRYESKYMYNKKLKIITVNPQIVKEIFDNAKEDKKAEALKKAYDYEENGTVEYKNCVFEMSKSNRGNLRDTVDALKASGQTQTEWNDKNDKMVTLTIDDIEYIRLQLIMGNIQKLWIEDYPAYLEQIANAKTLDELNAIVIDYTQDNTK